MINLDARPVWNTLERKRYCSQRRSKFFIRQSRNHHPVFDKCNIRNRFLPRIALPIAFAHDAVGGRVGQLSSREFHFVEPDRFEFASRLYAYDNWHRVRPAPSRYGDISAM